MALLELDSVFVSYPRGDAEDRVLRGVSLRIGAGEVVAVHGQRGSGKTTLLRVAAGYEPVQAGRVTFAGASLAGLTARERAVLYSQGIAWIDHTGPRSDELTAADYVALPLRDARPREARTRASEALARAGVPDRESRHWHELTNSERIRVAIAQGLVRPPRMLVVDDAALGLGVTDRDAIIGLLRSAAERDGIAVLMAVSDLTYALGGCRIHTISRGRLIGGAPEAVSGDGGTVLGFPARNPRPE